MAPDPAALARGVDVVMSCLADGFAVEAVYFRGKVLRSARPGSRIIEMSTVSPDTSRRLHWAGREYGLSLLDVTVSGSTVAAEAGTLTLFGGGEPEAFFPAIAKQWFYMGPSGSGVAMKLVVNTLMGVGMQAIAEAIALGSGLGLVYELLFDTLARTAVVAPAHVGKLATARHNDYSAQFPVRLMYKDFGLVLAAADRLRPTMPATESAAAVTSDVASNGREKTSPPSSC